MKLVVLKSPKVFIKRVSCILKALKHSQCDLITLNRVLWNLKAGGCFGSWTYFLKALLVWSSTIYLQKNCAESSWGSVFVKIYQKYLRSFSKSEENVVHIFSFPLDSNTVHGSTLSQCWLNWNNKQERLETKYR